MSDKTERPIVAERCPACGGFRTLRASAGYDKAVCRSAPECMTRLLEEAKRRVGTIRTSGRDGHNV